MTLDQELSLSSLGCAVLLWHAALVTVPVVALTAAVVRWL